MLAQYLDITEAFNANDGNDGAVIELSGWDYGLIQLVGNSIDVNFYATIDSGSVQNVTDGNDVSARNFIQIAVTDVSTDTLITTLSTDGIIKVGVVGRYLKVIRNSSFGVTVGKVLVMLTKIS